MMIWALEEDLLAARKRRMMEKGRDAEISYDGL